MHNPESEQAPPSVMCRGHLAALPRPSPAAQPENGQNSQVPYEAELLKAGPVGGQGGPLAVSQRLSEPWNLDWNHGSLIAGFMTWENPFHFSWPQFPHL